MATRFWSVIDAYHGIHKRFSKKKYAEAYIRKEARQGNRATMIIKGRYLERKNLKNVI